MDKTYTRHEMPNLPSLPLSGAALRSVQAADAAGRAAHQRLIDAQQSMIDHDAMPQDKRDATWFAQAARLSEQEVAAKVAISDLQTRWRVSRRDVIGSNRDLVLRDEWARMADDHFRMLAWAGVPVPKREGVPVVDFWRDLAAMGC